MVPNPTLLKRYTSYSRSQEGRLTLALSLLSFLTGNYPINNRNMRKAILTELLSLPLEFTSIPFFCPCDQSNLDDLAAFERKPSSISGRNKSLNVMYSSGGPLFFHLQLPPEYLFLLKTI